MLNGNRKSWIGPGSLENANKRMIGCAIAILLLLLVALVGILAEILLVARLLVLLVVIGPVEVVILVRGLWVRVTEGNHTSLPRQ